MWTCGECWCDPVTGIIGAWICSVHDSGHSNLRLLWLICLFEIIEENDLAFRIGLWIPWLGRLYIILCFHASIRNTCIREKSLEDVVDMHNLDTVWPLCAGELLLCRAVWRIHLLIIGNWKSRATQTELHDPPLILKKESVSTRLTRSYAFCIHQHWHTRHIQL